MQGKGTSYFADGSKYDGHFENEQYQGFGIFTFPNLSSVVRYEGEWEEDKKHGFGSTFNRDGSSYVGQVSHYKNSRFYKKKFVGNLDFSKSKTLH